MGSDHSVGRITGSARFNWASGVVDGSSSEGFGRDVHAGGGNVGDPFSRVSKRMR